jgi:kynureninase
MRHREAQAHRPMNYEDSRAFADARDREDPLAAFRERFHFPRERNGHSPVYLCGNSLGLQPKRAGDYVLEELGNWRDLAVDGHFHSSRPWLTYHRLARDGFAMLTGAEPDEVVAMNTLTVNLHLLMAGFYRPTSTRYKIVVEAKTFPSDRYAAASQLRLAGHDPEDGLLEWPAANAEGRLDPGDLEALLEREGDSIALLLLPGVQYYTGQVLDMEAICRLGRDAGCRVGLDLAHAVGNVELRLHEWAPDFAAWCTYKYLNGGPGAIAGAFVAERHFGPNDPGQLHGWWGHEEETRFLMRPTFTPAHGAELWQMSNPPVLSLAPVIAALEIFIEAGMPRIVEKSRALTGYLDWLVARRYAGRIGTLTPRDARGAQLSLIVRDPAIGARSLFEALCALNVTGDWREPDVIRVAPAPLYNSYADVFEFAERLGHALESC